MGRAGLTELERYTPSDAMLLTVIEGALSLVVSSNAVTTLDALHLNVYNPETASATLRGSEYATSSVQALLDDKRIVINEQFLLSLEAAIRAFAQSTTMLGSQYLRSDQDLFGLVERIRQDTPGYLALLRRRTQRPSANPQLEADIRRELEMVVAFFLAHEVGHLLGGHAAGSFGTFIDESQPLETRTDEAVVKLCRHVDEFNAAEFGLKGFLDMQQKGSRFRKVAEELRREQAARYSQQELFFQNEADADSWADLIILEHLTSLATEDAAASERDLYLLARGVFAVALYTWYRDLAVCGRKLGLEDGFVHANDITFGMIRSRDMYVHAASLFGEHHRFTFLRAVLHLKAMLAARADFHGTPDDMRRMWCAHDAATVHDNPAARREWWQAECIQRYTLLAIHMDTAVKLANAGCASEVRRRADIERGHEQMLMLTYESIAESVQRLQGKRPGEK